MSALRQRFIQRLEQNDFASYGHFLDDEQRILFVTLELPDRNNARNISSVPAGTYIAERYFSPHHQRVVFRLIDVPDRDDCEIHIANLPEDLRGCVALGREFGTVTKANGHTGPGVLESGLAFDAFMASHPEERFTLTILDPVSPATSIATPIGVAA